MNQAHFHLMVNHLPIIFPIVGALVLIGGFIFRSEVVKRVAYFVFIASAITTFPSFVSGEGAEEVVEGISGVSEVYIEKHEDLAKTFSLFSYALGLVSLVALWANWKKKSFASILSFVVLALSFVVLYFGKVTGTTGGEIRHIEIRSNFSQAGSADQGEAVGEEHEEEED